MPGATRRMYPARTRRRWLGTSASAGSSRSVRRKKVDIRSTRLRLGGGVIELRRSAILESTTRRGRAPSEREVPRVDDCRAGAPPDCGAHPFLVALSCPVPDASAFRLETSRY